MIFRKKRNWQHKEEILFIRQFLNYVIADLI